MARKLMSQNMGFVSICGFSCLWLKPTIIGIPKYLTLACDSNIFVSANPKGQMISK